jgi:hypothetical protein
MSSHMGRKVHQARRVEVIATVTLPLRALDLLPVPFHWPLDTHRTAFALGEALAHLHYLEGQGSVDRVARRYRPLYPQVKQDVSQFRQLPVYNCRKLFHGLPEKKSVNEMKAKASARAGRRT